MLTENDIAGISRRIVDAYAPLAVGTFGTYALGSARERSDLDLFIIKRSMRSVATARAFRRLLFDVLHPIDIHVFTAEEFEESVYRYLSFTWVIARQACVYYWTEDARRLVPSLVPRASGSLQE
jgi:hypothetical protein